MNLPLESNPLPLQTDSLGVARIGGTRVTLDTVVSAFREGATAEEIAFRYPALNLVDIYAVLTYYLGHQDEVDAYLKAREAAADRVRRQNQMRFDSSKLRERLLARQQV